MKRILIVEDDELNRDVLSRRLLRTGYDVLIATAGLDGLEIARKAQPDLILMDLAMPDIDGWECAKASQGRWDHLCDSDHRPDGACDDG